MFDLSFFLSKSPAAHKRFKERCTVLSLDSVMFAISFTDMKKSVFESAKDLTRHKIIISNVVNELPGLISLWAFSARIIFVCILKV